MDRQIIILNYEIPTIWGTKLWTSHKTSRLLMATEQVTRLTTLQDDFCSLQQLLRAQNEFWALNYNNEA
jgi:hypothetical protein